jgi:hypothetical protein
MVEQEKACGVISKARGTVMQIGNTNSECSGVRQECPTVVQHKESMNCAVAGRY